MGGWGYVDAVRRLTDPSRFDIVVQYVGLRSLGSVVNRLWSAKPAYHKISPPENEPLPASSRRIPNTRYSCWTGFVDAGWGGPADREELEIPRIRLYFAPAHLKPSRSSGGVVPDIKVLEGSTNNMGRIKPRRPQLGAGARMRRG